MAFNRTRLGTYLNDRLAGATAGQEPAKRLAAFDLEELQVRAERQLAGLEEHRVRAAIPALAEAA